MNLLCIKHIPLKLRFFLTHLISQITKNKIERADANISDTIGNAMASARSEQRK